MMNDIEKHRMRKERLEELNFVRMHISSAEIALQQMYYHYQFILRDYDYLCGEGPKQLELPFESNVVEVNFVQQR